MGAERRRGPLPGCAVALVQAVRGARGLLPAVVFVRGALCARALLPALLVALVLGAVGCRTVEEPVLPASWSEAEVDHALSHAECVALALRSAPTAAAFRARLDLARAALAQAGALPNPGLALSWEEFRLPLLATSTQVQSTVGLGWALDEVFTRDARESVARHELLAERASLQAEAGRLAVEVAGAYDALVDARARVALLARRAAQADQAREVAASTARAGLGSVLDAPRADADWAQARADRALAEADADRLQLALGYALGLARPAALELAEGRSEPPSVDLDDELALLDEAAAARPELQAARERYAAALERCQLVGGAARLLPTVGLGARRTGSATTGVASIDVQLPVFDSGGPAFAQQEALLLDAAAELRAAARSVTQQVREAGRRLAWADAWLHDHADDLVRRHVTLSEHAARLFAAGEVGFDEVSSTRRAALDAELSRLDALHERAAAGLDLAAALGRIDVTAATSQWGDDDGGPEGGVGDGETTATADESDGQVPTTGDDRSPDP